LYILERSPIAKRAFFRFLSEQTGCLPFPDNLRLTSQNTDKKDQSTPDLVGFDDENRAIFICENKFWAGLTENQPVSYLEQLERASGNLLLIIGPSKRIHILWPELIRRVISARYKIQQAQPTSKQVESAWVNGKYVLAFASWRSIISELSLELSKEGEQGILEDLKQLQGLCDQMDSDAFLPLQSEELTANVGQRIMHYCDLVDEAAARLGREGICELEGLRSQGSRGWYGRYMYIQAHGCLLHFNAKFWAGYAPTPIWLSIQDARGQRWEYAAEARMSLAKLEHEIPPRLIKEDNLLLVPIYLPSGIEKAAVIDEIFKQVTEIHNLLARIGPLSTEQYSSPPLPPENS
jgi:hypothetical protein